MEDAVVLGVEFPGLVATEAPARHTPTVPPLRGGATSLAGGLTINETADESTIAVLPVLPWVLPS